MAMQEMAPIPMLLGAVARNWWLILVRGLAAIAFGIVCLVWPAIGLLALVLLWGIYALVDGVSAIIWGAGSGWWSMVLVGIVSVVGGLIALFWPGITALALLYLIAAWAIVRGVSEIVAAVQLRQQIENEWALALGGAVSILFGVLIALYPGAGALSVVWLIGIFAIIFGIVAVALSLRLQSLQRNLRRRQQQPRPQEEEMPVGAASGSRTEDEDMR
jgi:uncharacterized membrane protein HdeD (DUF308 family)